MREAEQMGAGRAGGKEQRSTGREAGEAGRLETDSDTGRQRNLGQGATIRP